jgi:hypothetical protein
MHPTQAQYIATLITKTDFGQPIFAQDLAQELATAYRLPPEQAQNTVNVCLKRLKDNGTLARVHKGIYCRTAQTPFGCLAPELGSVMARALIGTGNNVIGYVTGAALANDYGLTTQLPAKQTIATNRYRTTLPADAKLVIRKPLDTVSTATAPYLQALELIRDYKKYPIDVPNPEQVIQNALAQRNLDTNKLIWMANKYLTNDSLRKIIEITLGDDEYREAA